MKIMPFFNWLFSETKRRHRDDSMSISHHTAYVIDLENRKLLSISDGEAYSWYILNLMRADPVKFGNELDGMYRRTLSSAHGYSASDPLWADLRNLITNSKHKEPRFNQAIALLRSQPRLGPLAWNDRLGTIAEQHNLWMATYGYGHSQFVSSNGRTTNNSLPQSIDGFTQSPFNGYDQINKARLGTSFNESWSENIGYARASNLTETLKSFSYGSKGFRQRAAYLDLIGYIIEVNNSSAAHPLGHLENLLSRDKRTDTGASLTGTSNKQIGYKNAIGIALAEYPDHFAGRKVTSLSTHTFSQSAGSGGHIAGIAYSDRNSNGFYDIGEGVHVGTVHEHPNGITVEDWSSLTNHGAFSVTASNGLNHFGLWNEGLGTQRQIMIQGNNVWIEYKIDGGFGLVGEVGPTLAADLYEFGSGNDSEATAIDFGAVTRTRSLGGRLDAMSLHHGDDRDWYRFSLTERSAVDLSVMYKYSISDVDSALYVKNADGSLSFVRVMNSISDSESYQADLPAGEYFIQVYSYNEQASFYSMSLSATPLTYVTVNANGTTLIVTGDDQDHNFVMERSVNTIRITGSETTRIRIGSTGDWSTSATMSMPNVGLLKFTMGTGQDSITLRDFPVDSLVFTGGESGKTDSLTIEAASRDVVIGGNNNLQFGTGMHQLNIFARNGYDVAFAGTLTVTGGTDLSGFSNVYMECFSPASIIGFSSTLSATFPSGGTIIALGQVNFSGGFKATLGGISEVRLLPNGRRSRSAYLDITTGSGEDFFEIGDGVQIDSYIKWSAGLGNDRLEVRSSATAPTIVSGLATFSMGDGDNSIKFLGSLNNPLRMDGGFTISSGAHTDSVDIINLTTNRNVSINTGKGLSDRIFLDGIHIAGTTSIKTSSKEAFLMIQTISSNTLATDFRGKVEIAMTGSSSRAIIGSSESGTPTVSFHNLLSITGGNPPMLLILNNTNVRILGQFKRNKTVLQ